MLTAKKVRLVLTLLISLGYEKTSASHYNLSEDSNGETLKLIAANSTQGQDIRIDISIPHDNILLNDSISFNDLYSLSINGDPNSATTIDCTDLAGIIIEHVTNIVLNNLHLRHCGSLFLMRNRNYSSALRIDKCNNISITNLVITRSSGIGLTILHHQNGKVHIISSNFTENKLIGEYNGDISGGGGVYIGEFQHCLCSLVSFVFEHCIFANNVAHTRNYYAFYTDEFGEAQGGHGRGGGAYVTFEGNMDYNSALINVSFTRCIFRKNLAFLGGGLSVQLENGKNLSIETRIKVTVENSVFDSNGWDAVKKGNVRLGGGLHLSYDSASGHGNELKIQNVNFMNNSAEHGGGIFLFTGSQNFKGCSLLFDNCTFHHNQAHTGSAIDMTPHFFDRLSTKHRYIVPVIKDCSFLNNAVRLNSESYNASKTYGVGTLFASLYDIWFEGNNHFENNSGTPVHMVNGVANFSNSNVTFKRNLGIRGGAIALIGMSSIIVGRHNKYLFLYNEALYQGGAIYTLMIDTHDFILSKSCFIQYFNGKNIVVDQHWDNTITFTGNDAPSGSAIYSTSIRACQTMRDGKRYVVKRPSEVFTSHGINISEESISTEGAHFYHQHYSLHAIPGMQYSHGVKITNDLNITINEPLRVRTSSKEVNLDSSFSSFVEKTIQLRGKPGKKANLTLQTVLTRETFTTFEIQLEECPPGFDLEDDVCVCKAHKYIGLVDYCDNHNFQSYLTPGLWVGLIDKEIVTSVCPNSFCDYSEQNVDINVTILGIPLPQNKTNLDAFICGKSREGVLCGKCRNGFTVHFHSPKFLCRRVDQILCKIGWFLYILSELVPVTIVFIAVLIFNISFTSGRVNGFILFSQILLSLNIDASGVINFPNQRAIIEGYQFLYGFLNMDFFTINSLSFCLWKKATALDMVAFKYITIIYAISLVILVIWFMNKCGGTFLGKWCRITTVKSSIIHGISAFLTICYSQTVLVSNSLIKGAELSLKQGSNITLSKRVWLDGNMIYFSASHLLYALPAIFCLVTIGIIPPILLLAYPLLNKVLTLLKLEECKLVTCASKIIPISSLKPLLDCFQSCFKDNLRFFAGLYFLYRWIAPVVYATSSTLGTSYILTEIFLILILAIHAFSQPYVKQAHNMIDTILFTDLLLINSITCIHYFLFQSQENYYTVYEKVAKTSKIQATLIYLPFIATLVYLLLLGCRHMYILWYTKVGYQRNYFFPKGGVHDDDDKEYELPHRLLSENISYEKFENTNSPIETY